MRRRKQAFGEVGHQLDQGRLVCDRRGPREDHKLRPLGFESVRRSRGVMTEILLLLQVR